MQGDELRLDASRGALACCVLLMLVAAVSGACASGACEAPVPERDLYEENMVKHGWADETSLADLRLRMRVHGSAESVQVFALGYRERNGAWPSDEDVVDLLVLPEGVVYVSHSWNDEDELTVEYTYGARSLKEMVLRGDW